MTPNDDTSLTSMLTPYCKRAGAALLNALNASHLGWHRHGTSQPSSTHSVNPHFHIGAPGQGRRGSVNMHAAATFKVLPAHVDMA